MSEVEQMNLRLSADLIADLRAIAHAEERSVVSVARWALRDFVKLWKETHA